MKRLVILAALQAVPLGAPPPPEPAIRADPDTVRVGEHFRLVATVPVPPGQTLFFPDTLMRTAHVETRRAARWSVAGARGDTAQVAVTYTLAAFRSGPTSLPAVPVVLRSRPPEPEEGGESLPGGSFVGEWNDLPRVPDFTYVRTVIEAPAIHTAPTLLEFDLMEGAALRGPADVVGGSWNPLALGLFAFLLAGLAVLAGLVTLRLRGAGAPAAVSRPRSAPEPGWQRAVGELDRVHALDLHRRGRMGEFYALSTDAVRRYVESLGLRWGPDLTTSELVDRARAQVPPGRIRPLARLLLRSEAVKFGRTRPNAAQADEDWSSLRRWVVEAAGKNGGPATGAPGGERGVESGTQDGGEPVRGPTGEETSGRAKGRPMHPDRGATGAP